MLPASLLRSASDGDHVPGILVGILIDVWEGSQSNEAEAGAIQKQAQLQREEVAHPVRLLDFGDESFSRQTLEMVPNGACMESGVQFSRRGSQNLPILRRHDFSST